MRWRSIMFILLVLIFVTGCSNKIQNKLQNVGMLFENEIDDYPWDLKGYEGLLMIGEKYDVSVFHEENVSNKHEIIAAVDNFVRKGANLIYGHGNTYGKTFVEISSDFPNVHFVYLGGGYFSENVTSMNINSHAMSFFAGMVASKMSKTNHVGIIASHEWQPEIEGFYEGAKYQNPNIYVHILIMDDRNTQYTALDKYEEIKQKAVDVIYPVGKAFSEELTRQAKEDGIYSIGYIVDQSSIGGETVLMSTVQHVDKLYTDTADKFNEQLLTGGLLAYDFQDEIISLGKFSVDVPNDFQSLILQLVIHYKDTNLLPSEY